MEVKKIKKLQEIVNQDPRIQKAVREIRDFSLLSAKYTGRTIIDVGIITGILSMVYGLETSVNLGGIYGSGRILTDFIDSRFFETGRLHDYYIAMKRNSSEARIEE